MFPQIIQVIPTEEHQVYVYFEDGKIVCFDVKPWLDKKVFEPLNELEVFMSCCTVLNDTLAWDLSGNRDPRDCIDIAPDMLYDLEHISDKIA